MDNAIRTFSLRTSAELLAAWETCAIFEHIENYDHIGIEVEYVKGVSTSMYLKVEESGIDLSTRTSDDWYQRVALTTTTGESLVDQQYYAFDTAGKYALTVTPVRAKAVRVSVKSANADVNGSSCTINGYLSRTYGN